MFAGLISKEKPVSAWGDPDGIMAALAPYSLCAPRDVWKSNWCMLLQVATSNGAGTGAIYQHQESAVAVAFWGRLDNRPDLIGQLGADINASDDEIIALAWLKWGEQCPEKLVGDFAFAIASPKTGMVFLARDVMGVKPLYYRADDNGVFFASSAAAFKPLLLGKLTVSKEWMARFLVNASSSHTDTAYEEIKKLPPAHCLSIGWEGRMTLRRFHHFQYDSPRTSIRDPHYLEVYRDVWQKSVACRLPSIGSIGCENSGGLDSGSITAEVARLLGDDIGRLHCFGYCRERLEPEAIMSVAMKFGITHNFISSRPYDYHYLPDVIDRSLAVNGYPIEIGVAEDHNHHFELAGKHGIGTLYSGFGGDEGVTSENWIAADEFLDTGEFRNLLRITPGGGLRKLYRIAKFLRASRTGKTLGYSGSQAFTERWQYTFFTDEAEAMFGVREVFIGMNDYANQVRCVNELAQMDLGLSYVPVRMENCTLIAASHGIDYVWPLLDPRLIQQWLSTPTLWKVGDGRIFRYLHRRAVDDVCPSGIAWKHTKDMGGASIHERFATQNNSQHFRQLLDLADKLPEEIRDIVDIEKLRQVALRGLAQDTRNYEAFSAMIMLNWNLQALVAWILRENGN